MATGRLKIWRCEYTGELVLGREGLGGPPLFGGKLPFIGWKWIGCDCAGYVDNATWPPRFLTVKLGVMWFGGGWFYTPPWRTEIRAVRPGVSPHG